MRFTKTITVAGTASIEVLGTLLASPEKEMRHLVGFYVTEVTATENSDAMIVGYLSREKVVDLAFCHLLGEAGAAGSSFPRFVDIDVDIPPGESFEVGHVSSATASNMTYTAVYTIKGK